MGSWDEICLICGISPEYVNEKTLTSTYKEGVEDTLSTIVENITSLSLEKEELRLIVKELLMFSCSNPKEWFEEVEGEVLDLEELKRKYPLAGSFWPPNTSYGTDERKFNWEGWNAIAVGTFNKHGSPLVVKLGGKSFAPLRGSEVATRLVAEYDTYGGWYKIIDPVQGIKDERTETSRITGGNFFCCVGPFRYLEAWLDSSSLPPRSVAFPLRPEEMSFAGELYEIVNTRKVKRDLAGYLPYIQYGGIEATLDQFQGPFSFTWSSSKNLEKALSTGLHGPDLLPALFDDLLVWQCVPPDIWSYRVDETVVTQWLDSSETVLTTETVFHKLPRELLDQILDDLSLFDAFTLLSISKSIIHFFDKRLVIHQLLRRRIAQPLGSLHWILPVTTMEGEEGRFLKAANSWFPVVQDDFLFDTSFPLFEFVQANYRTSSMKNRRRLWGISQQFRELWVQYRKEGYEDDVFETGFGPDVDVNLIQ